MNRVNYSYLKMKIGSRVFQQKSIRLNCSTKANFTSTNRAVIVRTTDEKNYSLDSDLRRRLISTRIGSHSSSYVCVGGGGGGQGIVVKPFVIFNSKSKMLSMKSGAVSAENLTESTNLTSSSSSSSSSSSPPQHLPSEQQLDAMLKLLNIHLPRLLAAGIVPTILFDKDVILENNFRRTRTVGIQKYMSQLTLLKVITAIKFAYVRFHILKITKHPEEGTIKCRWKIAGLGGLSVIFQFWKVNLKNFHDTAPTWRDGFSTYYVNSDGLIYKHVIDKVAPKDY